MVDKRRSPTRDELRVWRDFVESTEKLNARLATRLAADSGISSGDYSVLLALTEAPDRRLRSSELADTVEWERSRLSHHLARMEKRGLVRRERATEDQRGAVVAVTDAGRQAFRDASVPHLRAVRELFVDALTPAQLAAAEEIAAALRVHLQRGPTS
jgi:DNA-binding MarR family transcriptional regulator